MSDYSASELAKQHSANSVIVRALNVTLFLLVIVGALISGFGAADGHKATVVLPLAALIALALALLACTHFAAFVLLLLAVRASIDVLALSSATGEGGGASVSDRALNPSVLLGVLFLLASMLWLASRYFAGEIRPPSRLAMWLVAFWLAGVVSAAGSKHAQAGILESLRIMTAVMMFVVLEQLIVNRAFMVKVLVAAYASLLIPLSYTLFGLVGANPAAEVKAGLSRIIGTFSQSNDYARYLSFLIVFGVAIYPQLTGRVRVAMGVLLSLSCIFLLGTLTLTAIMATFSCLLLVCALQRRHSLMVGLVAFVAIAAIATPGLSSRVGELQTEQQVGGAPTGNSLAWRIGYWAEVLPLANSNPLTGIGLSATQFETDSAKQPHNDFLRAYVETGLVGLTIYLGLLASLVGTCWRAVRRTQYGMFDHAVAVGALACAVCFVVEAMASNVITNVVNVWYVLAFAAAASYLSKGRSPAEVESTPVAQPAQP